MRLVRCSAVLALVALSPLSLADDPLEPWTPDDIVQQERASSWTLSRDGTLAIWVKSTADKKKDRHLPTLMLTELESGEHRPLTTGQASIGRPAFSPSGRYVSFLSSRDFPDGMKGPAKEEGGSQIWRLDLRGGEARPITSIPFGVGAYHWHDDETIFLTARERRTRREAVRKEAKDDTVVVEDGEQFRDTARQLFRFDVAKKKLTRVIESRNPVASFTISPDGRWAVVIRSQSPHATAERDVPPRCFVVDLASASQREIFADTKNKPQQFGWLEDSSGFYAIAPHSTVDGQTWGAINVMFDVALPRLEVRPIDLAHDWGVRRPFVVVKDGFITGLCNGVRPQLAHYRRAEGGFEKQLIDGTHAGKFFDLLKAKDADHVIYVTGTASNPDHVLAARLDGHTIVEEKSLYRPNGGFASKKIAKTEVIRWVGAEEDEIEGILYFPHEYEAGLRYPLVLITHGGPHGADPDRFTERWANSPNLYAQRGAFVLKTNYHGSSDYGLEFGESIRDRYYELELIDMFSGIKTLIERGLVDRDRLGLVGWSNGAILSIAALTHADDYAPGFDYDFKACAPGAGDVNWTSDYGNCAFGASFDEFYVGGTPWGNPEGYLKKSPLFHVTEVTTPTIIFFGTEDRAVPTEQGWQWYRALHREGRAPVRFLLFPGAEHGLRKLTHQRRKLEEELAWFDRHLFSNETRNAQPVKEGSPLALAQKLDAASKDGDWYGVRDGQSLVPETVPFGEFEVGRFEVTRAQWSEYDGQARDRGNHPITGVTIDQARGYVAWLKEQTGANWRLLTAEEFEKLEKAKGSSENTLEHWAGYSPAREDAISLGRQVAALGLERCLFPVGSRPPGQHEEGGVEYDLYDVGGNVAELTDDGARGTPLGGYAVHADDKRRPRRNTVPKEFIGLRVAKTME